MDNLSEKELIIRDLYVVNNYYKNKSQYDKILQQKQICVDKSEVEILDKRYVVSSEKEIIDIFVKNGTKFNDDLGKNVPKPFNAKKPEETYKNPKSLLTVAILAIIFGFIPGLAMVIVSFLNEQLQVLAAFGFVLLAAGLIVAASGILLSVENKKIMQESEEYEKAKKENYRLTMEWAESQESIKKERYNNVKVVYQNELDKCLEEYRSNIERYNKTKNDHIFQIEQITDEINRLKRNSIIPIFYLDNDNAVEKMLFFMLNKRADTVKELVNLYETTVWQDAILKQLYLTNKNLIEQNLVHIEGLLKIDDSINRIAYDMEHLEFETLSFGMII